MQKSYECELATHIGPESCGASRKGGVEALPGERAGRVFSRVRQRTAKASPAPQTIMVPSDASETRSPLLASNLYFIIVFLSGFSNSGIDSALCQVQSAVEAPMLLLGWT